MNDIDFVRILFFALASVGLTSILVDGRIFHSFRERLRIRTEEIQRLRENNDFSGWSFREWMHGILSCYQCTGFWCGLFCCLLIFTLPHLFLYVRELETAVKTHTYPLPLPYWWSCLVHTAFFLCCGWATSLLSVLFVMLLDCSRSLIDYFNARTAILQHGLQQAVLHQENRHAAREIREEYDIPSSVYVQNRTDLESPQTIFSSIIVDPNNPAQTRRKKQKKAE